MSGLDENLTGNYLQLKRLQNRRDWRQLRRRPYEHRNQPGRGVPARRPGEPCTDAARRAGHSLVQSPVGRWSGGTTPLHATPARILAAHHVYLDAQTGREPPDVPQVQYYIDPSLETRLEALEHLFDVRNQRILSCNTELIQTLPGWHQRGAASRYWLSLSESSSGGKRDRNAPGPQHRHHRRHPFRVCWLQYLIRRRFPTPFP